MSKARIIKLLDILREHSDEQHLLNAEDLIPMLQDAGEEAERKTIYSDVRAINEAGYDVEFERLEGRTGYYYDGHLFEKAELRMLIDAVLSSSYLTDEKSEIMVEKLLSLVGKHIRNDIRETLKYSHSKSKNKQIFYNVDAIQEALIERRSISFEYYDYDIRGNKIKRNRTYNVIPAFLVLEHERYYLISYSAKYRDFTHYRLDRMEKIRLLDHHQENIELDVSQYMQRLFSMWSGEVTSVTLRCHSSLAEEINDKFADDRILLRSDENSFEVNLKVNVSETFFSWLFTFGDKIRILSPQSVIDEYVDSCRKRIIMYEKGA